LGFVNLAETKSSKMTIFTEQGGVLQIGFYGSEETADGYTNVTVGRFKGFVCLFLLSV
jgi:hypothetical protein